jgi:ribosomal protein L25 (general stress protein Ctc)
MAEKIELKVEKREVQGKKVRFLRSKGVVPVHLFGHNVDSVSLQGDAVVLHKVLSQAGRTRLIDLKVGNLKKLIMSWFEKSRKTRSKGLCFTLISMRSIWLKRFELKFLSFW